MFDFLSYVRDSGLEIKLLPPKEGVLIALEMRDPIHGFFEKHEIMDEEAASCLNIDNHTGRVLDAMAARIGAKRAREYADRHKAEQRRAREDFFRGE